MGDGGGHLGEEFVVVDLVFLAGGVFQATGGWVGGWVGEGCVGCGWCGVRVGDV